MSTVKINGHYFSVDRQVSSETDLEHVFTDFPHGDQYPIFPTQLDRDIYEHTPRAAQEPMGSHEVTDTCSRHMRPEVIAKRAGCSNREAIQLADALSVLDAGPQLTREVCRWAYIRGVEPTLKYLHPFLVGVAQAEMGSPDPQSDEEPVIGFQEIRPLSEMTVAALRRECAWREVKAPTRLRRWQLVNLLDRLDQEEAEQEETEPETLAYHALSESDECDWIESQPAWFQALIEKVRGCPSIKDLREIGKAVFASNLTGDRASVFWSFYNARKAYLERKVRVRPIAHKVVQRIAGAKHAELGALGKNLFRMQRGELKGPQLNEPEWTTIWAAYHERKQALAA